MSTRVRQYLYTAEDIYGKDALDEGMSRDDIWHAYEAERAKNAELIQQLVDGLHFERMSLVSCMESQKALDAAAAAGFKPSDP